MGLQSAWLGQGRRRRGRWRGRGGEWCEAPVSMVRAGEGGGGEGGRGRREVV